MGDAGLDLRGKSLLIFDDGLRSKDGHWFEYDRAVAQLHHDRGATTTILAHRDFGDPAGLEQAGARVVASIPASWWTGKQPEAGGPNRWLTRMRLTSALAELWAHLALARQFAATLERVLEERAYDLVFHPSAMAANLLAWALVRPSARNRAGRVVVLTRFGLGAYGASGPPTFARKLIYWKWIVRLLKREFARGRLVLSTDSERLASEYEVVTGVRPAVLASARTMPLRPAEPRADGAITFATLGAARLDKGIDLFQNAIEALLEARGAPTMRFLIQWNRPVPKSGRHIYSKSEVLEASPAVEFIQHVLSSEAYDRAMRRIDCMVLPYRRSGYHSQISGVAVEAACAGIPLIVTADTWLSDFLAEQGAGIAVPDGDAVALAEAIRAIAADYPAYRARAIERSAIARERNSPERFVRALWGIAQDATSTREPAR
ncbi:MAG: glycosyltransferase [Novosphingobium sp.]|nr:glycosyltransferase [Novosphingobium sp.]